MAGGPRLPKALRPLVGSVVLVGTVRAIDLVWRQVTGRRPPVGPSAATTTDPGADPAEDATTDARRLRDRLLYAVLLGAALRLARRTGLSDED